MKLYHYAKAETEDAIRREGITKGGVPVPLADGRQGLVTKWQWLTASPQWQQGWANCYLTDYDRTAIRFTVVIPKTARKFLWPYREAAHLFGHTGEIGRRFVRDGGGDADNWYVFHGRIPAGWIRGVETRPADVPSPVREIA